jgi:hypothetical protein
MFLSVFRDCLVKILARIQTILAESFSGIPQSVQENTPNRTQRFTLISFLKIHCYPEFDCYIVRTIAVLLN